MAIRASSDYVARLLEALANDEPVHEASEGWVRIDGWPEHLSIEAFLLRSLADGLRHDAQAATQASSHHEP
jgi:hypothetical protein